MNWSQNRLVLLVAMLLAISAGLFAVGTAIEHSQRGKHHTEKAAAKTSGGGETSIEKKAKGERSAVSGDTHSEKIAGIDPESWPLIGMAIAVSLLIAAGVYWRRGRWLVAAVAFGILFAAGDTRELVHQIQESRATVAVIAGVLIALHLLASAVAGVALTKRAEEVSQPV